MTFDWFHLLHQTVFGGVAAAGFGILFNCPPRIVPVCFGCGALALAVRTMGLDNGLTLPVASFIAALFLSSVDRIWLRVESVRGSVLAVVGCIPMVPGSLAAKGITSLLLLSGGGYGVSPHPLHVAAESLVIVVLTFAGIGTALAIPNLLFPVKQHEELEP